MTTSHEEARSMGPDAPQGAPTTAGFGAPGAIPPAWDPHWVNSRRKSPLLAALLSFMPGLGQIYIGYYQRGFVHAGIFAATITALAGGAHRGNGPGLEPLLGIGLGFFFFYQMIDAARRASLYNQALAGLSPVAPPEDFKLPSGRSSLVGGIVITVLGIMILLNTRFDVDFRLDWLLDWWPAFIVLIGINMVYRSWKSKQTK